MVTFYYYYSFITYSGVWMDHQIINIYLFTNSNKMVPRIFMSHHGHIEFSVLEISSVLSNNVEAY